MTPKAFFANHPVFTFEEFRAAHQTSGERSPQTTHSVLKQHVATGRLNNIRRGVYARFQKVRVQIDSRSILI